MNKELVKNEILEGIDKITLRKDIKRMSLFGSYLRNEQNKDSDVDLLIEFKPAAKVGLFGLSRLQNELEESLNAKVDLVTPDSLSRYFRSEVLSQAELIYEEE
ncbi:MAG: nucleotidyltransferase family protein [Parcubacteria group bacterium]|nr:nucleotidyltransferase family protein [Parcubacteria group bacterium]